MCVFFLFNKNETRILSAFFNSLADIVITILKQSQLDSLLGIYWKVFNLIYQLLTSERQNNKILRFYDVLANPEGLAKPCLITSSLILLTILS